MSAGAAFALTLGLSPGPAANAPSLAGSFEHAPALVWERDLPGPLVQAAKHVELGTPVIDGDHIFLGASGKDALFVLDRYSGTRLGEYPAIGSVQSAAVVSSEHVLFTDTAGYTFCYARESAELIWKHYGGAPILSSPVVDTGVVFVANVGGAVYALKLDDGSLVWRHVQEKDVSREVRLELYGAPKPVLIGDLVLVGFHNGALVGLSKALGERKWQRVVGEGRYSDIIGAPVVLGEDVLVSGFSTPFLSLKLDSRNVRWRIETGGSAAAIVDGDRVFHGSGDGKLRSIDSVTGTPQWTWEAPSKTALTEPVMTEAGLFVGTAGGELFLIDEDSGKVSWRLMPGRQISGFSASIAVEGRQMVVVTNAGRVMSLLSAQEPTP
jgi:outer membrane protein assembly factor BamB